MGYYNSHLVWYWAAVKVLGPSVLTRTYTYCFCSLCSAQTKLLHKYSFWIDPNTNSFLTQAFNLSIIHISNNARGQKPVIPSPIYLPSYREGDTLFSACQARLFSTTGGNNHLAIGHCSLSVNFLSSPFFACCLGPSLSDTSVASWSFLISGVYPKALWNCFLRLFAFCRIHVDPLACTSVKKAFDY